MGACAVSPLGHRDLKVSVCHSSHLWLCGLESWGFGLGGLWQHRLWVWVGLVASLPGLSCVLFGLRGTGLFAWTALGSVSSRYCLTHFPWALIGSRTAGGWAGVLWLGMSPWGGGGSHLFICTCITGRFTAVHNKFTKICIPLRTKLLGVSTVTESFRMEKWVTLIWNRRGGPSSEIPQVKPICFFTSPR